MADPFDPKAPPDAEFLRHLLPADECGDMEDVRQAIDSLDDFLIDLLALRGTYVARAGILKDDPEKIVDPARIEDIIARLRERAKERSFDPGTVEAVWRRLIEGYIALEREEYARFCARRDSRGKGKGG